MKSQNPIEAVWSPQPGSQQLFLACPIFEALLEGPRGTGKTDVLLFDFLKDVNRGLGPSWKGVLWREESTQLADIIARSHKYFPKVFPKAKFIDSPKSKWVFPDGEELLFRAVKYTKDYWKFHGWELPWQGWEELTNWREPDLFLQLMSCARSSNPKVHPRIRKTTNPSGPGHGWVKARDIDHGGPGTIGVEEVEGHFRERVRIRARLEENLALLKAQPNYRAMLNPRNEAHRRAWIFGDWDLPSGGAFDRHFNLDSHRIPWFQVPANWSVRRCFDWGSSAPFGVLWVAEANGEEVVLPGGGRRCFPKGSQIVIGEWYGWNGKPNQGLRLLASQIAQGILQREAKLAYNGQIQAGAADAAIFANFEARSLAQDMALAGVRFVPSQKGPGSREAGYQKMLEMLEASNQDRPEKPGLYFFETCLQCLRTLPNLSFDPINPDDVDTKGEDHLYDALRYQIMLPPQGAVSIRQRRY